MAARRGLGGLLVGALWGSALVAGLALVARAAPAPGPEPRAPEAVRIGPWVDPAELRSLDAPTWTDPRWMEHLHGVLAEFEPFALEAPDAPLAQLAEAVGALSFVARVARCAAGPAGLTLDLELREPVACIPVRGEFALVDAEGVVLEGRWPVPPRLGAAWLPVLGQAGDALLEGARAGDWLAEPEHVDALAVALSLREALSPDERARLGRVGIDAESGRRASLSEPGVRLALEGGRCAVFGRPPSVDAPGELDPQRKWSSLARAVELFERDAENYDWELVDLRWDRPDLALRAGPRLAALEPARATPTRARESERARRREDPARPQVR